MNKEFIIFYEHTEYCYYTTTIDGESIHDALTDFSNEYAYNEIYGIMEIK